MLGTGATALAPAGGAGEALAAAKREHVLANVAELPVIDFAIHRFHGDPEDNTGS